MAADLSMTFHPFSLGVAVRAVVRNPGELNGRSIHTFYIYVFFSPVEIPLNGLLENE